MKKFNLILSFMVLCGSLSAQYYYTARDYNSKKDFSYQVGADMINYQGKSMYGVHVGLNYKEVFDLVYMDARDYNFKESFKDNRISGIYSSVMMSFCNDMQAGPFVILNRFNSRKQKTIVGIEARWKLFWNSKIALFYGKGEEQSGGIRLIWNIY